MALIFTRPPTTQGSSGAGGTVGKPGSFGSKQPLAHATAAGSGNVLPVAQPSPSPSSNQGAQVPRQVDPYQPAPVQQTVGAYSTDFVTQDSVTAVATGVVSRTYRLPSKGDVTGIYLALTDTLTGTVTTTDISKTLAKLFITKGEGGSPVCIVAGTDLANLYADFSRHNNVFTTINVTNVTTAQTGTLFWMGLRLPVAFAPWFLQIDYNNYATFGTQVTAATLQAAITVQYGDAQGLVSHMITQSYTGAAANGSDDLGPKATVQNQAVHELIISGLTAAASDIAYFIIDVNGSQVESRLLASTVVGRDQEIIQGTLPATVLWLREPTAIAFNSSSHFWMFFGANPSPTIQFLYYWLAAT